MNGPNLNWIPGAEYYSLKAQTRIVSVTHRQPNLGGPELDDAPPRAQNQNVDQAGRPAAEVGVERVAGFFPLEASRQFGKGGLIERCRESQSPQIWLGIG